jgi:hypothetical protein
MFKDIDVWKFPSFRNTSMFKNTLVGHWHLLHRCYLGVLGFSFSTHSRILSSSEYFHYKIFIHEKCSKTKMTNSKRTSRSPVPGHGPAVEKHCIMWCMLDVWLLTFWDRLSVFFDLLTLEDGYDRLSWNSGNQLPSCTIQHPKTAPL